MGVLTKIIPFFGLLLLSCAELTVETKKIGDCTVTDHPYGWKGYVEVSCPGLRFTLHYDNIPDGRDPLVLGIEGVEAKRVSLKAGEDYEVHFAGEVLEGWRTEEEWVLGEGFKLKGYEYFVNGGVACYEEEEAYVVTLAYRGKKITLLDYFHEETDCGSD